MHNRSEKLRKLILLAMLAAIAYLIVSYIRIPAVLFLFEPVIGFRDVLPNWIGYLMLYLCLGQASDLCARLEESRAGFFTLSFAAGALTFPRKTI